MRVLVAGGTGFVGTALCRAFDDRGHDVTAMARHAPDDGLLEGVAFEHGDVTDRASLRGAFDGVDAVYNLVSLSPLFKPPGGTSHDAVHRRGTERLLAAAAKGGVERFVQQSALGASPEAPTGYLRAKGRAERAVADSDLAWTVLRPSVIFGEGAEFLRFCRWISFPPFSDALLWPNLTPLPGARSRFQPIWLGDFAEMAASIPADDRHVGRTYELGGPEAFTLAEILRMVHEAEGRPARLLPVPTSIARLGLSAGEAVPGFPLGADQGRSLDLDNVPTENDVGAFGVDPAELRPLRDYLGLG